MTNPSGQFNPYGTGTTGYSPIIALGEGWAFHMGHFLSDQHYGFNFSSPTAEQGITFNNGDIPGFSSHLSAIELFDPNLATDPFNWIPKGLMEDLIDARNEFFPPVNDNVSGFTTQQLYLALQADVNSVQQYRERLIQQNPGNQTNAITNLFQQYHY